MNCLIVNSSRPLRLTLQIHISAHALVRLRFFISGGSAVLLLQLLPCADCEHLCCAGYDSQQSSRGRRGIDRPVD